jgi:hypothetical protein
MGLTVLEGRRPHRLDFVLGVRAGELVLGCQLGRIVSHGRVPVGVAGGRLHDA